mgnify:CR=1 FL=1
MKGESVGEGEGGVEGEGGGGGVVKFSEVK